MCVQRRKWVNVGYVNLRSKIMLENWSTRESMPVVDLNQTYIYAKLKLVSLERTEDEFLYKTQVTFRQRSLCPKKKKKRQQASFFKEHNGSFFREQKASFFKENDANQGISTKILFEQNPVRILPRGRKGLLHL